MLEVIAQIQSIKVVGRPEIEFSQYVPGSSILFAAQAVTGLSRGPMNVTYQKRSPDGLEPKYRKRFSSDIYQLEVAASNDTKAFVMAALVGISDMYQNLSFFSKYIRKVEVMEEVDLNQEHLRAAQLEFVVLTTIGNSIEYSLRRAYPKRGSLIH